jgi:DNA-binding LacI/PurR family transcriptional regulator
MDSNRSPSVQLAVEAIRAQMRSGLLKPGNLLPTETALAETLDLSRGTIRRAIEILVQSGEVSRKRNARPRVESTKANLPPQGTQVHVWISHPIADDATLQFLRGISNGLMGGSFKMVVREPNRFFGDYVKTEEREFLEELIHDDGAWAAIIERDSDARNDDLYRLAAERGKCLVFADIPPPEGVAADYVGTANAAASRRCTEHLIQLGHSRIVYVSESLSPFTVRDRIKGYWRALSLAGMTEHGRVIAAGDLTATPSTGVPNRGDFAQGLAASGYYGDRSRRLVREILAMDNRPTAIVTSCDVLAHWVCAVLEEDGFHLPGDFAVVGFDWLARWDDPAVDLITTAAQDFEGFGFQAAEFVLDRSNQDAPAPGRQVLLPAPLQVRASTVEDPSSRLELKARGARFR